MFRFLIKNMYNNEVYYENSKDFWLKRKYDKNNNYILYKDSIGNWIMSKYDLNNKKISQEYSNNYK